MVKKLPGLSSYTDRHGRTRWRYRASGRSVELPSPNTPWFREAYQATVGGRKVRKAPVLALPGAALPATFGDAFKRLQATAKWLSLVRVERLREITNEDCIAEGIPLYPNENAPHTGLAIDDFARKVGLISYCGGCFRDLWGRLNAKRSYRWEANPWAVTVSFTVHRGNIEEVRS
jgi:hypothetical protein